jgi:hypothetical protein
MRTASAAHDHDGYTSQVARIRDAASLKMTTAQKDASMSVFVDFRKASDLPGTSAVIAAWIGANPR